MKTSYQGRAFLAREEGCVLTAYKDSVGVWTIGCGHTTAAGPPTVSAGLTLSLAECFALFERDLAKFEAGVNAAVKVPLTQSQFDALVSFAYNTGAIGRATFITKLNAGDHIGAANGMMAWIKPPEIIPRRQRERDLFQFGNYGDTTTIPVWTTRGSKAIAMALPQPAVAAAQSAAPSPVPPPPDIPKTSPAAPVARPAPPDFAPVDPILPPPSSASTRLWGFLLIVIILAAGLAARHYGVI